MTFDPSVVDRAVSMLQDCEQTKHLGPPEKVLLCDAPVGVGVEWPGEIRNAVAFHGPDAVVNRAEVKRRIEAWIAGEAEAET